MPSSARRCAAGSRRPARRAGRSSGGRPACTTSTCCTWLCRPRAASRPSRPPPITTARWWSAGVPDHAAGVVERAEREDALVVAARRVGACPSIGGTNGRLPVAMISLSYGVAVPSSAYTTLANRSIRSTRTPACSVMPFSAYQRQVVEEDAGLVLHAGEHVGQHDPVVVAVRLVAEHRDLELSAPPRARISSTVRAPAMPLPITTRRGRRFASQSDARTRPRSTTTVPVTPARRGELQLDHRAAVEVLDHPQRHVHVALGADREVAHRLAVAHQHDA